MALPRKWIELAGSIPPLQQIAMRIGAAQGKLMDGAGTVLPSSNFCGRSLPLFERLIAVHDGAD
ncbi:hypothetical protein [Rhizobium mesosinicum]|uniref:Uncharacterized protein n=1 Tax=Rhizobium mesosinicum TaxID=335017 RepID=A0ABS7H210_9HYPH|nr:hypothetical protein [Rhizobium mesosinicum]MBW9056269.1 hypothetical protein [Rhizobium mesosinicum]